MDQLKIDFHRRVHRGYLEMAKNEPDRWLVVNASGTIEEINHSICERLEKVLSD